MMIINDLIYDDDAMINWQAVYDMTTVVRPRSRTLCKLLETLAVQVAALVCMQAVALACMQAVCSGPGSAYGPSNADLELST